MKSKSLLYFTLFIIIVNVFIIPAKSDIREMQKFVDVKTIEGTDPKLNVTLTPDFSKSAIHSQMIVMYVDLFIYYKIENGTEAFSLHYYNETGNHNAISYVSYNSTWGNSTNIVGYSYLWHKYMKLYGSVYCNSFFIVQFDIDNGLSTKECYVEAYYTAYFIIDFSIEFILESEIFNVLSIVITSSVPLIFMLYVKKREFLFVIPLMCFAFSFIDVNYLVSAIISSILYYRMIKQS